MLYSMRRRMREMAEGEARGESYWSERFAGSVRVRIMRKVDAIEERGPTRAALFVEARREILDEAGMDFLATPGLRPFEDFAVFWRDCDDELFPTVIEAFIKAVRNWEQKPDWPPRRELAPDFIAVANEILAQERVAWKIVNDQMVEMKSQELHEAVVEPALRLLHDARFSAVDATYRKALDELSRGDGGDAITRRRRGVAGASLSPRMPGESARRPHSVCQRKGPPRRARHAAPGCCREGHSLGGRGQKPNGRVASRLGRDSRRRLVDRPRRRLFHRPSGGGREPTHGSAQPVGRRAGTRRTGGRSRRHPTRPARGVAALPSRRVDQSPRTPICTLLS